MEKTYGKIGIISQLLKKIKLRKGYIPINVSMGLIKDLKKNGFTK